MKLPVITIPKYLSPTGFMEWDECAHRFYLKRLAGHPWPHDPQSLPAAVGSYFDCLISHELAKKLGTEEMVNFDETVKKSVEPHNLEQAKEYAEKLFHIYIDLGCLDRLWEDGISSVHPDVMKEIEDDVGNTITILGKPDATRMDGGVQEFKVNGAFSSPKSPNPGYDRCYYSDGNMKTFHPRCQDFLEEIDTRWATQLAVYTWLDSGLLPFRTVPVHIEQVAIRGDKIAVASFNLKISKEFQFDLWNKMVNAWNNINKGNIPIPNANPALCEKYNKLCPVADKCDYYQAIENMDEDIKDLIS